MIFKQEQIVSAISPSLLKSPIYEKFKEVYAREAAQGEKIVTYTDTVKETENTANSGDYVVKNTTTSGEEYIVEGEVFNKRYESMNTLEDGWKVYKAKGKCRAIPADQSVLCLLKTDGDFKFMAPWGEEMICKVGDMLVCPTITGKINEVYRIGKKEFEETYRQAE